ncbi:hypothetical protein OIE69_17900 [Actinacidiphila glaucinigra]|uniref:hypothetical protein n=1 Tax=Actinacidiphila glaucinigra TaxID=235986 RepID=UPI002DDB5AB7|nr:hypothetical protein [Actinacidiphila glaucinigra]WSD60667.1 hypothetical protein OIE69_17900 [Actinacidiphila glaucinigra]
MPSPGVREEVDGYVLRDNLFPAVRVVFLAGWARGPGLHDARLVVGGRYDHHGDRIARHDWFVDLPAITADPAGEQHLATIHRGAASRYLGGERDASRRHPLADAAARAGRAQASVLSVPFHFASPDTPATPDTPDDRAPCLRLRGGEVTGAIRHFQYFGMRCTKEGKVVESGTQASRAF